MRGLLIVLLASGVLTSSASAAPASVTVAGSFQSELGCPGDWQPDCATTHLTEGGDDLWRRAFSLPAGDYEYKAAVNDGWTENYGLHARPGGANIPLKLPTAQTVTFYFDPVSHWITDSRSSVIATAVGDFQSELGCAADWQPDCLLSWLEDVDGDGIYTLDTTALPPGNYEMKVALNESWDVNYGRDGVRGGANIPFTVEAGQKLHLSYDPRTHVLRVGDPPVVKPPPKGTPRPTVMPRPTVTPDRSAPELTVRARRQKRRAVRRRGAVVRLRASEPCRVRWVLLRGRERVGHGTTRLSSTTRRKVHLRLGKKGKRRVRHAHRLTLELTATDAAGNRGAAVRRRIRLRR